MSSKIRVAILDDHQSIIDGYCFRLSAYPEIEVAATAMVGSELESILAAHAVDVLLLDVGVPTAKDNPNPYPILHLLPRILQTYPGLTVLVISMYDQRTLIRSVVEAGASGYILKDDQAAIQNLGSIIHSVANGGVYFSQRAHQLLLKNVPKEPLLSPRQLEALSLCVAFPEAKGAELAEKLCVANSTMRNLLSEVYIRLEVSSRSAAVAKAQQLGLVTPADPLYKV